MPSPAAMNPATRIVTVTPSDTTDLSGSGIRAMRIGGAGDIVVVARDDDDVAGNRHTFTVVAGEVLTIAPKIVRLTNTTATLIKGYV